MRRTPPRSAASNDRLASSAALLRAVAEHQAAAATGTRQDSEERQQLARDAAGSGLLRLQRVAPEEQVARNQADQMWQSAKLFAVVQVERRATDPALHLPSDIHYGPRDVPAAPASCLAPAPATATISMDSATPADTSLSYEDPEHPSTPPFAHAALSSTPANAASGASRGRGPFVLEETLGQDPSGGHPFMETCFESPVVHTQPPIQPDIHVDDKKIVRSLFP
jgi:hypothetical protein